MSTLQFIMDNFNQVMYLTWEHIWIVGMALLIATPIGVTLGILITRHEQFASRVLNGANILMTIPSLALFGLMLPILAIINMGLGKVPAVIALVLYSQLPIIRNTYTAIKNVPPSLVDAGMGMGMSKWKLLREVEIPLAMPLIIAGLRTAAVMNIGVAAIARVYPEMIMSGAILVSLLAIIVDGGMALLERMATPEGIKVQRKLAR